jgi:hypothetical protein
MAEQSPIEIQKHLSGLSYPASKDEVVATAEEQGADDALLQRLRENLGEKEYESPADVMSELSGAL